nr:hypothetical protein [Tanacetum cinerariifolium]
DMFGAGLNLSTKVKDIIHDGSLVWPSVLLEKGDKVDWFSMVWFNFCIPRHAFNLWLIVKRKLKTQDMIRSWEVSDSLGTTCALCLNLANHDIYALISLLQPVVKRRMIKSIIVRLVIAAFAYYIWQKHNWRLFKSKKRTVSHVIDCMVSSVRLKLLSCKLKKSRDGQKYATLWDLPEALFV